MKLSGVLLSGIFAGIFVLCIVFLLPTDPIMLANASYQSSPFWSLAVIATMPIAWYCIVRNHSYVHYWYTFRDLSVSVFAVSMMPEVLYHSKLKTQELKSLDREYFNDIMINNRTGKYEDRKSKIRESPREGAVMVRGSCEEAV